jgi:hypothetical protein
MKKLFFALSVIILAQSCDTGAPSFCSDGIQNGNELGIDCGGDCPPCASYTVEGHAQKGPFLNGSSVLLSVLDSNLNQLGTSYTAQIIDNSGYFLFNSTNLASPYVALRADGFYFNEVCGSPSNAQITLNAVANVNAVPAVNVNTLTHLEKARVEYLIGSGLSFAQAKQQALQEILNIFNIDPSVSIPSSELLSIASSSAADGVLIAITSILQGYRSESEFSDLMANLVTDLRTDGMLNSTTLASELISHAKLLDTATIRQNIVDRYAAMGITVNVPNFGQHIQNYIDNTTHQAQSTVIDYPETGLNGLNLLNTTDSIYTEWDFHSLVANRPNDCLSLKLVIEKISGNCQYGCWFYSVSSVQNWNISSLDQTTQTQTFISTGLETDLSLGFEYGTYRLNFYINDEATPSRVKVIQVN